MKCELKSSKKHFFQMFEADNKIVNGGIYS